MGMRLLPRSEVDKAKATDRLREVNEGKKLATRVDSLRELASVEEKNLASFRDKTLNALKEDILSLNSVKSTLSNEVKDLQKQRDLLLVPLDAKWLEVTNAQKICNDWEETLEKREEDVTEARTSLYNEAKELETKRFNIQNEEERVKETVDSALLMRKQAKEVLAQARNDAHVSSLEAELTTKILIQRELTLAARERDVEIAREYNEAISQENRNAQVRLDDERGTISRIWDELKLKQNG